MPSTEEEEEVIPILFLHVLMSYQYLLLKKNRRISRPLAASASFEWDLNMWDDSRCWSLTRFHLHEIRALALILPLPNPYRFRYKPTPVVWS
ncbi:hypothetical protein N7535_004672 [Penicillium sp. DV-2018c]|nr:hypothetical protein N7461_008253 [Penicillium sp. DV-2018c]KAJ5571012.1 hypothetical protein N7535_004672 [Penicillium sp. DV-2018c]